MTEYRSINRDSVTIDDPEKHRIRADVTPYNVWDTYETRWIPGVWSRSLETWKPPMAWAHRWEEPIGKLVDYSDDKHRLQTLHELDDFDAVPRAKQAWAQLESGTLVNFSFGFNTVEKREAKDRAGGFDMIECGLDEVSPVLRGAVPGTKYVGSRGRDPLAGFLAVAQQLERGELTLDDARAAVIALDDGVRAVHSHARQDGAGTVQHSHAGDVGMHAHSGLMPVVNGRATIMSGAMGPSVGPMEHTHPKVGGGTVTHSHPDATASHTHDGLLAPLKRSYDAEETRADAKYAMEDGSFPINNCADVSDAAKLAHNSKTYSFAQVRAHVLKAKQALGCPDSVIPDSWNSAGRSDEDIATARQLLSDIARR